MNEEFVTAVKFLITTETGLNELSEAIEAFRTTKGVEQLAALRMKAAQIALACNTALERVERCLS